ncbi:unknown [Clostridium sp. CAG:768]|jgi:hypothetical protein|uniref:hypothetical protein n=1 Tax=Candidatus Stercorousia sp. TaxID=3048886 RepID=UPI000335C48D|nr:unknown [Clostridium sp. CAG:768]
MAIKVDGIQSEDELRKAQAAAQAQGTSITNYNEWAQILQEFQDNGIESTGSYSGDKARMQEIQAAMQEYAAQLQEQEKVQQNSPDNKETEKVQKSSETDRNQELKATVANATSSQIMADYMKYYHLLM